MGAVVCHTGLPPEARPSFPQLPAVLADPQPSQSPGLALSGRELTLTTPSSPGQLAARAAHLP